MKKVSRNPVEDSPQIYSSAWFPFFFLWQSRQHLCDCILCLTTVLQSCAENHRTPKCSFNWVTSQWLANRFHMLLDCPPLYASSAFFLHSSFWAACLRENNYIWNVVKWPRSCRFCRLTVFDANRWLLAVKISLADNPSGTFNDSCLN